MHQREWVDARRRRPRHFTVSLIAVAILAIPASVALFGVVLGAVPRDLLIAVLIGVVLLLGAGLMWGASYISNMVQCEKCGGAKIQTTTACIWCGYKPDARPDES